MPTSAGTKATVPGIDDVIASWNEGVHVVPSAAGTCESAPFVPTRERHARPPSLPHRHGCLHIVCKHPVPEFGELQGRSDRSRETSRRMKAGGRLVTRRRPERARSRGKAGPSGRRSRRRMRRRAGESRKWRGLGPPRFRAGPALLLTGGFAGSSCSARTSTIRTAIIAARQHGNAGAAYVGLGRGLSEHRP